MTEHDFALTLTNCWVCGRPIHRAQGTRFERDGIERAVYRHSWNSDNHYGHPAEHTYRLIHEDPI
jgi:hypothetical protein